MQEVTEGLAKAYQLRFFDFNEQVAQVYLQIDMSNIVIDGEPKKEAAQEEVASTKEVAIAEELMEKTTIEGANADEVTATKQLVEANLEGLAK